VKKSLAFYRDFLGLKLIDADEGDDWGGHRWLMMTFGLSDQRQIALVYLKGAKRGPKSTLPKDARHIALAETGALDIWRVKLTKAKVAHWEELHGDRRSLYFEDPNGNDRPAANHAGRSRSGSRQNREALGQGRQVVTLDAHARVREGGVR
jgi:catechol 2,3-dioxygenase-like lactoylglutathione lyase family enzyme